MDPRIRNIKLGLVSDMLQDEGFVTPGSQFSSENLDDIADSKSDSSSYADYLINDYQCLKLDKRTWEQLGNNVYYREKPFASEVPETVVPFWKIWNARENPKKKTFSIDSQLEITFEELKNDLRYLLFGMESSSFFYDRVSIFHLYFLDETYVVVLICKI